MQAHRFKGITRALNQPPKKSWRTERAQEAFLGCVMQHNLPLEPLEHLFLAHSERRSRT